MRSFLPDKQRKFSYSLLRTVQSLNRIESKVRRYGTTQELHEAEIHLIKFVKENEGIHISRVAERLGITRGAVSQMVMKLQKKRLVRKEVDRENRTRILLRLTPEGETANEEHARLHRRFDELVDGVLDGCSPGRIRFLRKFLKDLRRELKRFP